MRLAWLTPLPPMPSGISEYSAELLPLIAEKADVEAICPRPGPLRRRRAPRGIRVRAPSSFLADPGRYDAVFHHLGNNPDHEFVYEAALRHPGICVFHDFVLHHLISHTMVRPGHQPERYERILRAEHGAAGSRVAELAIAQDAATQFEKFVFPLNTHVARAARGVIVHSEDSRDRMRAIAPGVPVRVIPHHAGVPPAAVRGVDRAAARRRLGLPPDGFLVGHFGFVSPPKQPAALIAGFAQVRRARPDALLLVVGADTTGGGLARLAGTHGVEDAVRTTGYVDLSRFYLYLKAVDAVVNLRYPSAGESSGTLARTLSEGRAAVVNNYGAFAEVPSDAALKVEIDGDQGAEVGAHLVRLAEDPAFRRRIEEGARRHARAALDPLRCRDSYLAFARDLSGGR